MKPTPSLACLSAAILCSAGANAATLHGRVKDQRCSVLAQATVHIHPVQPGADRTLTTDDSGNYNVELPSGQYKICVQRDHAQTTCSDVSIADKGDTWITTQLRDAAPDLSGIGNRSY